MCITTSVIPKNVSAEIFKYGNLAIKEKGKYWCATEEDYFKFNYKLIKTNELLVGIILFQYSNFIF